MRSYFSEKSLPIFPIRYIDEKNISILFKIDFSREDGLQFVIAGESEFQIFLNGKLIGYGPARAAHGYHRVDKYNLKDLKEHNRLVVILASYRVNTFDRINTKPFIQFELKNSNHIIASSNLGSEAYLYEPRYQKVVRLSYQRAFSESYNSKYDNKMFLFGNSINLPRLELQECFDGKYLPRRIHYPKLNEVFATLKEKNKAFINEKKEIYQDRYMFNEGMGIFPVKDWVVDPNKVISQIDYEKLSEINNTLKDGQSLAYAFKNNETGFLRVKVKVSKPTDLYIYFDEINNSKDFIDVRFYRNYLHDAISYELNTGEYDLIAFVPNSAKYVRVATLKGEAVIESVSMILLEHPDSHKLKYHLDDKKLKLIFDSARRTFASNAVDILMDCPSRERAGWLCDSYFTSRAEMLFTGKNLVERNFLENYALYRYHGDMEKGMVPMCYPADFFNTEMYIPNWAMFYVVELEAYINRHNDNKLIRQSKKNVKDLVKFFKKYENEYGLLENLENWIMIDWSHANDPESICGVNIPSNALYMAFLKAAGTILKDNYLLDKAKSLRKEIQNGAFDGEFFVDNLIRNDEKELVRNNRYTEATLYYLFYFNVINKDEYPDLFQKMINDFGPHRNVEKTYPQVYPCNAFIGDYLRLEILLRYGYSEKALEETVDYFYNMAKTTGTLWEHAFVHGSLNHGFASYAANIIFKALTGVKNIDYINKVIYKGKTLKGHSYKFVVPINNQKITFSDKGDTLIDGYKIVTEE